MIEDRTLEVWANDSVFPLQWEFPLAREVISNAVRNEASMPIESLRSHIGNGSVGHYLFGNDLTHDVTSAIVGAVNAKKGTGVGMICYRAGNSPSILDTCNFTVN